MGGVAALLGVALVVAACGSSSNTTSSASSAANNSPAPASSASSGAGSTTSISTAQGSDGTYLTGSSGRALYLWVADSGGKSSCSGACAKAWPPVLSSATPNVSGGATASDLGTISRSDGAKQVTYKGHPLYYFIADSSRGSTKGQGSNNFGAKWWLVGPSGTAITKGAAGSSSGGSSGAYGGSQGSQSSSSAGGGWS
jgi:predicted lipoprotein with Yx(FWY)xxD motif